MGSEASSLVCAPRIAWLGAIPLYEPTGAVDRWLRDFASFWWCGNSLHVALAWACAHCETAGFFADKTNEKRVRKLIEAWFRDNNLREYPLATALNYALNGDAVNVDELLTQKRTEDGDTETGQGCAFDWGGCPYQSQVNDALAAGLGVTADELERHPRRIVTDILRRWMIMQAALNGGDPSKLDAHTSTRAYIAYDDYLISLTPKEAAHGEG